MTAPVLVTGGRGFLGGALVTRLLEQGRRVRSFSRGAAPELAEAGVEVHRGDLGDATAVDRAVDGCELVFHVAAKAGVWGAAADYERANVEGTRHVLDACRHHGVQRLVFTSSPSVTFGGRDQDGVDEAEPYPPSYLAHYPRTKAEAEQLVIDAASDELATVSLRPHLIWGPGDPHLVPRIIDRARHDKLRLIDGSRKLVDWTSIHDAARAHLLAAEKLEPGTAPSGRAYFISSGAPLPMADLINAILSAAEEPPVKKSLPAWLARVAGAVLETGYGLAKRVDEPPLTRFVAAQLATAHWFRLDAARRDFGYEPEVDLEAAVVELAESLGTGDASA
ncbi:MAG: NAD-dependent epimerase/dehydratase family protein [Acidobacteriota bacterium]